MKYRILLAGGGTGGHVYPLIAVAKALKERAATEKIDIELLLVGDGEFIEKAAEINKLPFQRIVSGKLRRYFSVDNLKDILKMPIGFVQSLWCIYWFMPEIVFAKGGYASVMPALAARIFLIPVFIHESDFVPGLSNTILAKIAEEVFISFEASKQYFGRARTSFVGNPIRKELFGASREAAVKFFNLDPGRKTILVLGGSLGAKVINELILTSLVLMTENYQIIHQCGDSQYDEVKKDYDKLAEEGGAAYGGRLKEYYHLSPFLEEEALAMAYAAADVIISRAGGQLFELAYLGKPAIIIPRAGSPGDHQAYNASSFGGAGGIVIEEQNFTRDVLIQRIGFLLEPKNYSEVSEKIKSFAKPDAADKIAEELVDILKSKK